MKFKFYLFAPVLACLPSGCLFAPEKQAASPEVEIHVVENDTTYVGIPLKIWITLKKPVSSQSDISWERGTANIFKRGDLSKEEIIRSDTVYLEWRELPNYTRNGASKSEIQYLDTVRAIVNGVRSPALAIEVKNLFPIIDSMGIGSGLGRKVINDSINISIPQGSPVVLMPYTIDKYHESTLEYDWPEFLRSNGQNPRIGENGVFYFDDAPTREVDYSGTLSLYDGSGATRQYHVRYRTYDASKSIWVGSSSQLVKFAEEGFEIFRRNYSLGDEILMGIHSAFNALYVADDEKKLLKKFNTLDLTQEAKFIVSAIKRFQNIALSPGALWVAEEDPVDKSKALISKYSADNGASQNVFLPNIPGKVLSMSANPHEEGGLWFINSVDDTVYYANNDSITVKAGSITGPKKISYDFEAGLCWVATSTDVFMLSKSGQLQGKISGFKNISSISSGSGFCWVSDSYLEKVWLFNSINTRNRSLEGLSPDEVEVPVDNPVFLSIINGELPSVWVVDAGKGALFKVNAQGSREVSLSGMVQPRAIAP